LHSDFRGLSAAIRLRARGHDATIAEQPVEPHDGFVFDDGPALITAPWLIQELFDLAGRAMVDYVTLIPLDPFYQVRFEDGAVFRYSARHDEIIRQIRQFNVKDVQGYLRYRDAAARAFDNGARQDKSVEQLVRSCIRDERLRQVFTAPSRLAGTEPFHPASPHTLEQRWGVWYPLGGTPALWRALVRLFTDLGGTLTPAPAANTDAPTPSLTVFSFGTDCQYPDMAHHEILVARDTWIYLHRPSATDASLAPLACDSWSVMTPLTDRASIIEILESHALPSLARHIVAERPPHGAGTGDRPGTGLPGALDAGKRRADAIDMPGC
jgi:phytoene desaturase